MIMNNFKHLDAQLHEVMKYLIDNGLWDFGKTEGVSGSVFDAITLFNTIYNNHKAEMKRLNTELANKDSEIKELNGKLDEAKGEVDNKYVEIVRCSSFDNNFDNKLWWF